MSLLSTLEFIRNLSGDALNMPRFDNLTGLGSSYMLIEVLLSVKDNFATRTLKDRVMAI